MPATHEEIGKAIRDPQWDNGVKALIMWQFGYLGDFQLALWQAIAKADEENLHRLALGYPAHVRAFRDWAHGDLGDRLRAAGLGI